MIRVKIFVFNSFQENTYVLHDQTGECIIIDPGCQDKAEEKAMAFYISENLLKPVLLVNTHGHIDHVLGNAWVQQTYALKTSIHTKDAALLSRAVEQGKIFGLEVKQPPDPEIYHDEGDIISFGHSSIQVLHVPGHTPGGVALYAPDQQLLISGDVLFQGTIGRTDLPGGDFNTIIHSIQTKLLSLPDETVVYPGHGMETTIGDERRNNPFLQ
jgi:hydroxyacylglutathione hydrolase